MMYNDRITKFQEKIGEQTLYSSLPLSIVNFGGYLNPPLTLTHSLVPCIVSCHLFPIKLFPHGRRRALPHASSGSWRWGCSGCGSMRSSGSSGDSGAAQQWKHRFWLSVQFSGRLRSKATLKKSRENVAANFSRRFFRGIPSIAVPTFCSQNMLRVLIVWTTVHLPPTELVAT